MIFPEATYMFLPKRRVGLCHPCGRALCQPFLPDEKPFPVVSWAWHRGPRDGIWLLPWVWYRGSKDGVWPGGLEAGAWLGRAQGWFPAIASSPFSLSVLDEGSGSWVVALCQVLRSGIFMKLAPSQAEWHFCSCNLSPFLVPSCDRGRNVHFLLWTPQAAER